MGGVDISFLKSDARRAVVCLTVLSYPALKVEAAHFKEVTMTQPYIPGLLAFRECECLEQLLTDVHLKAQHDKTIKLPQVIFVDGNGKLHHRAFGLACHLGVKTNLPTIGIGKKLLLVDDIDKAQFYSNFGKAQQQARQTNTAGSTEVVMPVQGRSGVVWANAIAFDQSVRNPAFVSVGHRVSLATATRLALRCCCFRIPEPVRQADILSRQFIRDAISASASAIM